MDNILFFKFAFRVIDAFLKLRLFNNGDRGNLFNTDCIFFRLPRKGKEFTKENIFYELVNYWPLFFSVFIGGLIGNYLNLKIFSNRVLAIMTSLLVIFVSIRIGIKIFLN